VSTRTKNIETTYIWQIKDQKKEEFLQPVIDIQIHPLNAEEVIFLFRGRSMNHSTSQHTIRWMDWRRLPSRGGRDRIQSAVIRLVSPSWSHPLKLCSLPQVTWFGLESQLWLWDEQLDWDSDSDDSWLYPFKIWNAVWSQNILYIYIYVIFLISYLSILYTFSDLFDYNNLG